MKMHSKYTDVLAILSALTVIVFGVLYLVWKNKAERFSHINKAPTYPIVGSIFNLERDPHQSFKRMLELADKLGHLFVGWIFFTPVVLASRTNYVEFILSSREHLTKAFFYVFFHSWLGTGLLTSTGEKWRSRRKALTPCFHFSTLKSFHSIFLKHTQTLLSKLSSLSEAGHEFDIQIPISLATLDSICETAMGVTVNAQSDTKSDYVNAVNIAKRELQVRQKSPWLYSDFVYSMTTRGKQYYSNLKYLHDFTTKVINDRISKKSDLQESSDKRVFLDMLLHLYENNEIGIDGIREEVDTFMFGGHDTTSSALSWTLYCLGRDLHTQRKLQSEIDSLEAEKDKDEDVFVQQIRCAKYLDCVFKEAMRLHPPVSNFGRELQSDTVVDGKVLPKGTVMIVHTHALHTNPEYWDEPDKFYPERFLDESFLKRHPYSYIPFSAGPRNCIGQKFAVLEAKIILYHVLRDFEVYSMQNLNEIEPCFEIIHKSRNGIMVKLTKRQK